MPLLAADPVIVERQREALEARGTSPLNLTTVGPASPH
jgi:hypothetical protein